MQTFSTQEALSARKTQKTTSSFSALLIAGIIHAVIVGGLAIWYLATPDPPEPELIVSAPVGETMQTVKQKKELTNMVKQAPSAASSQMSKLITSRVAVSTVAVPDAPELTLDTVDLGVGFGDGFGDGDGFGSGFGEGGGPPKGSPLSDRCSAKDRKRRLEEGGGTPETEAAVVKGLQWLKTQQSSDGSWGRQSKVAMTGLALLAYLGHCETYDSKEYGETVRKAIFFLAEQALNNEGKLSMRTGHAWVYEHGIGTYALCEAYSLLRYGKKKFPHMEAVKEAMNLAVPIIIDGQHHDGGWIYEYAGSEWHKKSGHVGGEPGGNGDTSITGWHMQALKAATLTGIEFKGMKRAIRNGIKFLQGMQGPQGGFGYRNRGDRYSLAGVGALAQQMLSGSSGSIRRAVKFILEHEVKIGAEDASIYAWYYAAQACFQKGGRDWEKWNDMFRDQAVAHQSEDGSWPSEGGEGGASSAAAGPDAPIYRTALFILMLEVYYRYLPATE